MEIINRTLLNIYSLWNGVKEEKKIEEKIEEEKECVICYEEDVKLIKFKWCKHKCICLDCYLKMDPINEPIKCPLCRGEIRYTDGYNKSEAINKIFYDDTIYYNFLKNYLSTITLPQRENTIYESYENIPLKMKFTVYQCECLLDIIKNSDEYILRHMIVSMCREPWNIDVKLGKSGVCYYGNMGEIPYDLGDMLKIIIKNHESMKERNIYR